MYGEGRELRYFFGFIVAIALLVVAIVLIINHSGSGKKSATPRPLTSYVNDPSATVTETIIGPISAEQTHDQIQISVSNQTASMYVSTGYQNNVTASKTYPMSTSGFSEFLYALNRAGFTQGNNSDSLKNDQGYCPTGSRYVFTLSEAGNTVERYWATTCGGPKTYRGNLGLTNTLFQAQIPDYDSLASGTSEAPILVGL